jgi:pyridoxal 5'-phosphate synthase pdxS subunit
MALERVPADIRATGGVARMVSARLGLRPPFILCAKIRAISRTFPFQSDPQMIKEIVEAVSIPVMAKVRIGHIVEAQVATFTGEIKAPLIKPYRRYYKALGSTTSTSQKC